MAAFGSFVSGQVLTAAELNAAGAYSDYTPTWTQSATITKTVNWARYSQFNKIVTGSIKMTATGAGTSNNTILVGLPVSASSNNYVMGTGIYISATGTLFPLYSLYESATTIKFTGPNGTQVAPLKWAGQTGAQPGDLTIASGAIIYIHFTYEAA